MLVAYELKLPLETVESWDVQTFKWWLAFFKRKQQLEAKATTKGKGTETPTKRAPRKRRPR